jgi:hypothetical protein
MRGTSDSRFNETCCNEFHAITNVPTGTNLAPLTPFISIQKKSRYSENVLGMLALCHIKIHLYAAMPRMLSLRLLAFGTSFALEQAFVFLCVSNQPAEL